jgi:hypothetical protein
MDLTDEELRARLREIDEGEAAVTEWEANFLESVVYKYHGPLSDRQRDAALELIDRYA